MTGEYEYVAFPQRSVEMARYPGGAVSEYVQLRAGAGALRAPSDRHSLIAAQIWPLCSLANCMAGWLSQCDARLDRVRRSGG
jgi:hypothetical protein